MKINYTRRGFTLIELLVVVLIIGILAAVAVPQYQISVIKSRVATILPLGKAIVQAQYAYYMANGSYTYNMNELDINMNEQCKSLTDANGDENYQDNEKGKYWGCGDFMIDNSKTAAIINYCPNYNTTTPSSCRDYRDFSIEFYYPIQNSNSNAGRILCSVKHNSSLGKKICSSLSL